MDRIWSSFVLPDAYFLVVDVFSAIGTYHHVWFLFLRQRMMVRLTALFLSYLLLYRFSTRLLRMWHRQLHTLLAVFLIILVFIALILLLCFSYCVHLFNNLFLTSLLNMPACAHVFYDKLFLRFETYTTFSNLFI